jgi:hypothetical protein
MAYDPFSTEVLLRGEQSGNRVAVVAGKLVLRARGGSAHPAPEDSKPYPETIVVGPPLSEPAPE